MGRGIRSMSWLIRQIAEEASSTDSGWVKHSSGKECLAWKASFTLRRRRDRGNTFLQPAESSLPHPQTSKGREGKGRRPCRRHVYFMRPITVIWSLAFCSTWAGPAGPSQSGSTNSRFNHCLLQFILYTKHVWAELLTHVDEVVRKSTGWGESNCIDVG